jgi:hypothetical protein
LLRNSGSGQQLRGVVVVVGTKDVEGVEGRHGNSGGKGHAALAHLRVGTGKLPF